MEVQTGQRVRVPHPSGEGTIRAKVIATGEPSDAIDVTIAGREVKRDVAIIRYEEGESEGLTSPVPYHLLASDES
jgi:hypothetical protein